jgi:DNA-binding transcriptional regulator PaaX
LDWLLLAYSLPKEPSRYRVAVWRRLRKLGAVYLNEGLWVLPNRDALPAEVQSVIAEVRAANGVASAFTSQDLDADQGGRLQARFLDARDEEYSELLGQYNKFVLHVDHARSTRRYTFAEVEELEEELAKLERWLEEIHQRDFFGSPQFAGATSSIEAGRELLQAFVTTTYEELGESPAGADVP